MKDRISIKFLCKFIYEAKCDLYVNYIYSPLKPKSTSTKMYIRISGDFQYKHQLFGDTTCVGEETVWYQGTPIWSMSYYGGINQKYYNIKIQTLAFLRQSLHNLDPNFPIRGPKKLVYEEYCYQNKLKGNIIAFTGIEKIMRNNRKVYLKNYTGGLLMNSATKNIKLTLDI